MPLEEAIGLLRDGAIVAVKGLGGYHLACDAAGEDAVARLRVRKHREEKPFALMTAEPELLAALDEASLERPRSSERPIVLLPRREGAAVAPSVAPGTSRLGVMLSYTPLHHLLAYDFGGPLVLTSGNRSDEPMAFDDDDARERLAGIDDAFLAHDRPIHRRCEDSVWVGGSRSFPVRRSRGYVPAALRLPGAAPRTIVAAGESGEILRCDLRSFERRAHLDPVPLQGGKAAIREPWRLAAAYLERARRPVPFEQWDVVSKTLAVNARLSSGMGRLFDAVAAILGVRERVTYEGQAAIELEQLAGETAAEPYAWQFGDGAALVAAAHDDLAAGRPRAEIAAAFHEAIAAGAAEACAEAGEPSTVVLSGGTVQNLRLLRSTRTRPEALGFRVLTHERVPPNDVGVSFGQAAVAAARTRPAAAA